MQASAWHRAATYRRAVDPAFASARLGAWLDMQVQRKRVLK
ncbi:hypothetical protein CLU86_3162 [Acidovorax sp. 62]|nr:hypothetical protein CLU86_3162 [Acidovorax sp. 62]